MTKQKWPALCIDGHPANPGELEFRPFLTLPLAMEAIRLKQPFEVWAPVHVRGKPGDWLVHMDGGLHIFTDTRFKELYKPTTISALEAELNLLGPPKRPWTATHGSLDLGNPPSSFTAVTPPQSVFRPETIAMLRRVGAITTPPLDTRDQPPPVRGKKLVASHARDFFEAVLQHQEAKGLRKYGTPLETFNGRNPLLDLLGELVDAVMYCSQAILERMAREDKDAGDP